MLHKAIVATSVLLLMTVAVSAQTSPELHFKPGDKPSRTKDQKEYDKALDRAYQSATKKIPEQKKSDPWADIRSAPPTTAKNKQQ